MNTSDIKDLYNVNVHRTLNNTIVTLFDSNGYTLYTNSCGGLGYKKSKRKHFNAYNALWFNLLAFLKKKQIYTIRLHFYCYAHYAVKFLLPKFISKSNIKVFDISINTLKPFNGCKLSRPKR